MSPDPHTTAERRVLMLGTFGLRPKGTMSARAAGIAVGLKPAGWRSRIVTVPWDNPADAGESGLIDGIEYRNTRTVKPGRWPLAAREMVRQAEQYRPDLIYLFKPKGFGDLAARWLRRRGYPVVVDMDDWEGTGGWNDTLPYSRLQRMAFDWQEQTWPSRADAVTASSKTLLQRAHDLGANPAKTRYLPNGLTRERFQRLSDPPGTPLQRYPPLERESGKTILLYTRFVEFDPRFVARVLTAVTGEFPDVRLVVAGESDTGRPETVLAREARRAGIATQVEFLGWIHPDDLGWIAGRCTAALVPFDDTLINRAKCSVKVLELMARGIPIVASSVGENREYLGSGRYGELATPGDCESHARLLGAILHADPDTRRVLGERAQRRVGSAYLWESLACPVTETFESALLRSPQRSQ